MNDTRSSEFAATSLATAEKIGRHICREAIWFEDRCTWMGSEPIESFDTGRVPASIIRSLGPDLYSGTSGVALFLGELHGLTGDPSYRKTSLGAIRHALSRAEIVTQVVRGGLFSGWLGIALVAARLALRLSEPGLKDRAGELVGRALSEERHPLEFDLMSGRAGAIVALLALEEIIADPTLLDIAILLGDELLDASEISDFGRSWRSRNLRNRHNLTGLSHGASGPAFALLELHGSTGEEKYKTAALDALAYERHWFDPKVGNWPDFRQVLSAANGRRAPKRFMEYWCHGAPGIVLARLRAFELLGDATLRAEAIAGLTTTCRTIESELANGSGNFSLCHGLLGNAETVEYGRYILGADAPGNDLVERVASVGIDRFAETGRPWPCGTHAGETPNLMLGLSGIGHAYLRMDRVGIPSVLFPLKDDWARADR